MPDPTDWPERSRELARLLANAALGDAPAFAELYERTSAHLYAVVLRINRDRAQAEDILQEVYVSVWRAARSFDAAQSQPLTWLTSIARNRAIDSLRRKSSEPAMQSSVSGGEEERDVYDTLPSDKPGPLELLSRASDAKVLDVCLERLNAQQRQSLALAFYDGLSHVEVATQMAQPLGTVKSWLRRSLISLKECLKDTVLRSGRPSEG